MNFVKPSEPSEPLMKTALKNLENYQIIDEADSYIWFLPSSYFVPCITRPREVGKQLKRISYNTLDKKWCSSYNNGTNVARTIGQLEQFIDKHACHYMPPKLTQEQDDSDDNVSMDEEDDPLLTEVEDIMFKATNKAKQKPEVDVSKEQEECMFMYIQAKASNLTDSTQSYDLHINALKHSKHYRHLIQDDLCYAATKDSYRKVPAYLKRCLAIGANERRKEERRRVSQTRTVEKKVSVMPISHTGEGLPPTVKIVEPSKPSEPLQNTMDISVDTSTVQKVQTVQDIQSGVETKSKVDDQDGIVSASIDSTTVPIANQEESSAREQLLPIPYQSFYIGKGLIYSGRLRRDVLSERYAITIARMNQYFQYHEPTNQVLVTYKTTYKNNWYGLKSISEFEQMCSHTKLSYTVDRDGRCIRMNVTVADIWLNERGFIFGKGIQTRKLMLDDPSELLAKNKNVFLPIYCYTDMNTIDKWIYTWLQSKEFCQTPDTLAPTTEALYNHFMEFSEMNRRDFRQKELTSELYQRFPCVKRSRLRRRNDKSVVDIPAYKDCIASFQQYINKLGMRMPPLEVQKD